MEKGQSTSGTLDSSVMKSLGEREHTESHDFNDIMYRRMKNRERQRRYRARKRLEADTKKSSCVISQSIPSQVELQLNGDLNSSVTPVRRRRDWKKDARRAHASKDQEDRSSGSFSSSLTLTDESQIPCMSAGAKEESSIERVLHSDTALGVVNCETQKTIPGRRDWKAAARSKKSGDG